MPLHLPYPLSVEHDIEIHFAHAVQLSMRDENRQLENNSVVFGYAGSANVNRITLHYTLENLTASVPPNLVDRYLTDLGAIRNYVTRAINGQDIAPLSVIEVDE